MKKRVSGLLLVPFLLLLVTVFGFAGGQKEPAAMKAAEAPTSLVLWDVQTASTLRNIVDEIAQKFRDDHPNVDFEVVHIQNDPYKTKLKVAMGAGTPPDIFHNWGGGPLKAYIDSNNVQPMDETVQQLLKTHLPSSFDPVRFDGHIYGRPYGGLTGVFVWYRKDIFAQYGLQPPKTWQEFLTVGETLKRNGITPIALANKTKWTGSFYYMYLADRVGGADMFVKAYDGSGSFAAPGYERAGELIVELVNRGFFPQGFNGMDYDTGQSRTMLYTGKAGMQLMGSWILGAAKTESPEVLDKLGVFQFPAVGGGAGDPSNLIGSPGQNYFSIAQVSKSKDLATKFLRDYVMNERWVNFMAANGFIPPVQGASSYVSDPLLKETAVAFEKAKHVQIYYDQYMPPELGERHKDLVQALFGLSMTPQQVARSHQQAYEEYQKNQ